MTGANLTSEELDPSAPAVLVNVWQLVHTKDYAVSWQRYSSSQKCKNLFPSQRSHQLRGSVFNIMFSNHRWWDEKMNWSCSNVICVFINLQRMRFSFTSRVYDFLAYWYITIYTPSCLTLGMYSLNQIAMARLAVMEENWISTLAPVHALSQNHSIYQTRIVQVKWTFKCA
mgnify:CR=1 FL=1